MTTLSNRLDALRQSSPVERSASGGVVLTAADRVAPQPPLAPPSGPVAPWSEVQRSMAQVGDGLADAIGSGDPAVLMHFLTLKMRDTQQLTGEASAQANQGAQQAEATQRAAAFEKAAADQRSAAGWGLFAKVAAYVAALASAVVGVCAAVFTGGTSLAGGIALAVVLISTVASVTTMALSDAHVLNPEQMKGMGIFSAILTAVSAACSFGATAGAAALKVAASCIGMISACVSAAVQVLDAAGVQLPPALRYTLMGVSVAGALTSAGMGLGSLASAGSAASSAANAGRALSDGARAAVAGVRLGAQVVQGAALVAQGSGNIVNGAYSYSATESRTEGTRHAQRGEALRGEMDDLTSALQTVLATFQRAGQRLNEAESTERSSNRVMINNLGRA